MAMTIATSFRLLSPQPLEEQYVVKYRTDLQDDSPYNYDGWHRYCQEDSTLYICKKVATGFMWEPISGGNVFKNWEPNTTYEAGDLVVHETICYEVDFTFTSSDNFINDRFQMTEYISRDGEHNFSFIIRKEDWIEDLDANLYYYQFGHKWEETNMIFDFWDNDTLESIVIAYEMTSEDITTFWTNQLFNCVVNVNFGTVNDDTLTNRIEHMLEWYTREIEKLHEKDKEFTPLEMFGNLDELKFEIDTVDETTGEVVEKNAINAINYLYDNMTMIEEVDELPDITTAQDDTVYLVRHYKLDENFQITDEIEYYSPYTVENGNFISWHRPLNEEEILVEWQPNTTYNAGELVVYDHVCYIVNNVFTSGEQFEAGLNLKPYIGIPYVTNRTIEILENQWTEDVNEELYFYDYEHDIPLDYLGVNFYFTSLDTGDSVFIATDQLDLTHYRFWSNYPVNVEVCIDTGYSGSSDSLDEDKLREIHERLVIQELAMQQVQPDVADHETRIANLEASTSPDLEPRVSALETITGDITQLQTTNKDNLVDAINELVDITPVSEDVIGNLNDLHTNEKETIVAAINDLYYLKQDVADPDIECEEKSVVGAINLSVKSMNKTIKNMIVVTSAEYDALITPDENGVKLVDPYTMYILIDVEEEEEEGGD